MDRLIEEEFTFIGNIESYLMTKASQAYKENFIVLTLNVPRFFNEPFLEVIFEPIPDDTNRTLVLDRNILLIQNNESSNTLENNNLEKLNDSRVTKLQYLPPLS